MMKKIKLIKIVFMASLTMNIISCSNASKEKMIGEKETVKRGFVLQFEEEEYNFGPIDAAKKENEFVSKEFVFVNNNDKPLIITKADVSCGCISAKIPEKPVLTGEKGIVTVTVDTKQLNGSFNKSVYVKSNAENDVELLRVTGQVKK